MYSTALSIGKKKKTNGEVKMATATKGIMGHKYPDFNPAQQGIVYCKISEGKNYFPQFKTWWDKCGGVCRRGIYQYADISIPVADNVSFMVQHLSNYAGGMDAVKTEPIIFYANYGWSLTNIQLYINYLWDECLPKTAPKPMVYITPKIWTQIYKGDDANTVAWNIAQKADVCVSAWDVELPVTFGSFPYPKAWEYGNGKLQVKSQPGDTFVPNVITPVDPVTDPVIPGTDPVVTPVTVAENVRLECLNLAVDVAEFNAGEGQVADETLTNLAEKLVTFVNKKAV